MARSRQKPARLDEFGLIARYFAPLAADPGAFGLLDDAAVLPAVGRDELVVTTDAVVETVHFFADDAPGSIARKALGVNLSDLAAKGAAPFGYLVSLALPRNRSAAWLDAWLAGFSRALKREQRTYGIALLGGDTVQTPSTVLVSVTAFGRVPKGRAVLRSGARPGDLVFVSGTIGDAALGLAIRRGSIGADEAGRGAGRLLDRYLHPRPRVALAPAVRRHASAALDVSDGLWADVAHMCTASGVGAEIDGAAVPLSPPARRLIARDGDRFRLAVTGGDDYEIVAAVPEKAARAFARDAAEAGVAVARIGRIVEGHGAPVMRAPGGEALGGAPQGHTHF